MFFSGTKQRNGYEISCTVARTCISVIEPFLIDLLVLFGTRSDWNRSDLHGKVDSLLSGFFQILKMGDTLRLLYMEI